MKDPKGKQRGTATVAPLFEAGAPTSEVAWTVVKRIPLNANFSREYRRCTDACCRTGKGHGPYWFAIFRDATGKQRSVYIGSDEKLEGVKAAHEVVRRDLAEAEAKAAKAIVSPEIQRLQALQADAYSSPRRAAGGVVSVRSPKTRARPQRTRSGS